MVLLVTLVGRDLLQAELRHPQVLGHGHRELLIRPVPLQQQLLGRLGNCGEGKESRLLNSMQFGAACAREIYFPMHHFSLKFVLFIQGLNCWPNYTHMMRSALRRFACPAGTGRAPSCRRTSTGAWKTGNGAIQREETVSAFTLRILPHNVGVTTLYVHVLFLGNCQLVY